MAMVFQNLGCSKKHSDMRIMPTSMHLSRNFTLVLPFHHFLIAKVKRKTKVYASIKSQQLFLFISCNNLKHKRKVINWL
ncbi:hypothetical protein Hanom_Chr12g01080221 [Helianthus anomalus]